MSGTSRSVSLRRRAPDGSFVRLSVAQVDVSSKNPTALHAVQHVGVGNGHPPAECVTGLRSLATPTADALTGTCGYDWRNAEVRRTVRYLWDPFLPGTLRGLDDAALLELVKTVGGEGPPWRPRTVTRSVVGTSEVTIEPPTGAACP